MRALRCGRSLMGDAKVISEAIEGEQPPLRGWLASSSTSEGECGLAASILSSAGRKACTVPVIACVGVVEWLRVVLVVVLDSGDGAWRRCKSLVLLLLLLLL
jgi:hypothetical protein